MKKILLSTVALLSLSAGAMAADLPSRRMAPAPYVAVPVFTWTGFYFGVNAGYGFSDNNRHDDTISFSDGTFEGLSGGTIAFNDDRNDSDGFLGGAQIGYNWQFTPGTGFVIGVEADIQGVDFERNRGSSTDFTTTFSDGTIITGDDTSFRPVRNDVSSLDYFGTVRARLGYAFDKTLVYATGGYAYGGGSSKSDCEFFSSSFCGRGDDNRDGYAVGGGVEFALPFTGGLFGTTPVTLKVEGLYVNLENDDNKRRVDLVGFDGDGDPVFNGGGNGNNRSVRGGGHGETEFGLVRAGINFKF